MKDLEKSGKDNEAFKGSVDQISMVAAKLQIDEKTLAENEKRATEGPKIKFTIHMYPLRNNFKILEREAYLLLKKQRMGLWPCPKDSMPRTIFWYYTWLIRAVFKCTIPNPKTNPKWYPLSFVMCIIWIGVNTYLIFFMMIVIGELFNA